MAGSLSVAKGQSFSCSMCSKGCGASSWQPQPWSQRPPPPQSENYRRRETKRKKEMVPFLKMIFPPKFPRQSIYHLFNQSLLSGDHYVTSSKEMGDFFWNFKHRVLHLNEIPAVLFLGAIVVYSAQWHCVQRHNHFIELNFPWKLSSAPLNFQAFIWQSFSLYSFR